MLIDLIVAILGISCAIFAIADAISKHNKKKSEYNKMSSYEQAICDYEESERDKASKQKQNNDNNGNTGSILENIAEYGNQLLNELYEIDYAKYGDSGNIANYNAENGGKSKIIGDTKYNTDGSTERWTGSSWLRS